MNNFHSMLSELIVSDLTGIQNKNNNKQFISWKDKLFLFDDDSDVSTALEYIKKHPSWTETISTSDDLINISHDLPPDVLSGVYYPNERTIHVSGYDKGNAVSSVMLKKIIKQLKIKRVTIDDLESGDSITYSSKKSIGDIPSIGFHGTNTLNLIHIMRYGINASLGASNFGHSGVYHDEDVFFGATFDIAKFYAEHSRYDYSKTYNWNKTPKKPGAEAVVIELNIPDRDKVIPDFDADAMSTQNKHYNHEKDVSSSHMKSIGISKEMGKFGYKGRILPTAFRWIYIFSQIENRWKKFKPSTVTAGLRRYDEDWYYRVGVGEY